MVKVNVSEGLLEGTHEQNENGGSFYSFKGIPYAAPPIGELRFRAPQPPKPWKGVRSAKEYSPRCYQVATIFFETEGAGSEDCLYLNVFTPNLKPEKPLAVMVWIHGGSFFCGTGDDNMYGPEYLLRHDVVIVTINYRVDILGFLCLDIEEVPGNAGLKDQAAALRWIKKNISNFGGDPNNITIFGESAGGASVSYQLISPMSKGLFKRAIAQSGTSSCHWALATEPRERAIAFARELGFTSTDPYKIYEFLKSLPVEKLVKSDVPLTYDELDMIPFSMPFLPVSEQKFGNNEAFFTGDVFDALRNGIHEGVDVMSGYTEHEAIFSLMARGAKPNSDFFKHAEFLDFFCPMTLRKNSTRKQIFEIGRQMRNYFINDDLVTKEKYMEIVRYYSLDDFTFDAIRWNKFVAKSSKNKCYLYKFTCKSALNFLTDVFKQRDLTGPGILVAHADDLVYLFKSKMIPPEIKLAARELKMIETVTSLWTNFAKYGNPTPDDSLGARWVPFSLENQEYMDIGEALVPGTQPEKADVEFWESVYRKYLPGHLP